MQNATVDRHDNEEIEVICGPFWVRIYPRTRDKRWVVTGGPTQGCSTWFSRRDGWDTPQEAWSAVLGWLHEMEEQIAGMRAAPLPWAPVGAL